MMAIDSSFGALILSFPVMIYFYDLFLVEIVFNL